MSHNSERENKSVMEEEFERDSVASNSERERGKEDSETERGETKSLKSARSNNSVKSQYRKIEIKTHANNEKEDVVRNAQKQVMRNAQKEFTRKARTTDFYKVQDDEVDKRQEDIRPQRQKDDDEDSFISMRKNHPDEKLYHMLKQPGEYGRRKQVLIKHWEEPAARQEWNRLQRIWEQLLEDRDRIKKDEHLAGLAAEEFQQITKVQEWQLEYDNEKPVRDRLVNVPDQRSEKSRNSRRDDVSCITSHRTCSSRRSSIRVKIEDKDGRKMDFALGDTVTPAILEIINKLIGREGNNPPEVPSTAHNAQVETAENQEDNSRNARMEVEKEIPPTSRNARMTVEDEMPQTLRNAQTHLEEMDLRASCNARVEINDDSLNKKEECQRLALGAMTTGAMEAVKECIGRREEGNELLSSTPVINASTKDSRAREMEDSYQNMGRNTQFGDQEARREGTRRGTTFDSLLHEVIMRPPAYKLIKDRGVKFGGNKDENPMIFLDELQELRESYNLSDDDVYMNLPILLQDKAKIWYTVNRGRAQSLTDFIEIFKKEYANEKQQEDIRRQIAHTYQEENENLHDFINRYRLLMDRRIPRHEEGAQILLCYKHTKPVYQKYMKRSDLTSWENFKELGEEWEQIKERQTDWARANGKGKATKNETPEKKETPIKTQSKPEVKKNWTPAKSWKKPEEKGQKATTGETTQNSQKPKVEAKREPLKCFGCGKEGHIIRNCEIAIKKKMDEKKLGNEEKPTEN